MQELVVIAAIFIGVIAGVLGGFFGLGSGIVTVPFLYLLYNLEGIFAHKQMQVAISTSLAIGFVIACISSVIQGKKRSVSLKALFWMIPFLIAGSITGVFIAHDIHSDLLKYLFAVVALAFGIYFLIPKKSHLNISNAPNYSLSIFASLIGLFSSLLGIGGGSIAFPILLGYQLDTKTASGTSSFATLITTFVGSLFYFLKSKTELSAPWTLGYIDLKMWALIVIGSSLAIPVGVKLSEKVERKKMTQVFGGVLLLIGLGMFL